MVVFTFLSEVPVSPCSSDPGRGASLGGEPVAGKVVPRTTKLGAHGVWKRENKTEIKIQKPK